MSRAGAGCFPSKGWKPSGGAIEAPPVGGRQPQEREHRIGSYNKGCRCELCRAAAADAKRRWRTRTQDRKDRGL